MTKDQTRDEQAQAAYLLGRRRKAEEIKRRMDELLEEDPDYFLEILTDEDEPLSSGPYQLFGNLPTEKQLAFLRQLKFIGEPPRTKKEASTLIDQLLEEKKSRSA